MRFGRLNLPFCALLLVLSVTATSRAENRQTEADERYEKGIRHYDTLNFAAALAEFEKVDQLAPTAQGKLSIALTLIRLGQPVRALDILTDLMTNRGTLTANEFEHAKKTLLEQKKLVGTLTFSVNPKGATIKVDGVALNTPLASPLRVTATTHEVEVTAPGYLKSNKQITVAGQVETPLVVDLILDTAPLEEMKRRRTWTMVALIGGGTLAAGGSVLMIHSLAEAEKAYNDTSSPNQLSAPKHETAALAGGIGMGLGVASLVVGTILATRFADLTSPDTKLTRRNATGLTIRPTVSDVSNQQGLVFGVEGTF